jgi:hypothetical protein
MRVLFDNNVPYPLRRHLAPHSIQTAAQLGWGLMENGELLQAAEDAGADVMVTADQNIRYQRNLTTRRISLVVLGSNRWRFVRRHLTEIVAAVNEARAGSYAFIEVPLPPKPKYQRAD